MEPVVPMGDPVSQPTFTTTPITVLNRDYIKQQYFLHEMARQEARQELVKQKSGTPFYRYPTMKNNANRLVNIGTQRSNYTGNLIANWYGYARCREDAGKVPWVRYIMIVIVFALVVNFMFIHKLPKFVVYAMIATILIYLIAKLFFAKQRMDKNVEVCEDKAVAKTDAAAM